MRNGPLYVVRLAVVCALAFLFGAEFVARGQQVKIGSLDLTIGGLQATVTPANPVIPKNIASGVQIVVTQSGQTLSPAAIAQYLGGPFQLVGEYSGPGLTQTVEVPQSTPAANSLIINLPAVSTAGNYTLSNLRFLVNGAPVFDVTPSTVTVQVIDQVLVTSVQTTPLTLTQIEAMGVVLDSSAYSGFMFTVGLQFSSQVVNLTFPVVFNQQGVAIPTPLSPPASAPIGVPVPLPTLVPILLQGGDGSPAPSITLPDGTTGTVQIPSVIVIPGNVGYLKQFFSAQLYVANGAPAGSNLTVDNITGTIGLPPGADGVVGTADDPLSLPDLTSGPQSATMNILAPGPGGTPSVATLNPGDTGQGQWTIRGDKEGYDTINFGITATLEGLPTGPFNLTGTAVGGVLVRNPFFNMTFTVPGVVRKGEVFNVFATVSNISQVAANNLTVNFNQGSLSGVTLVSPPSPVIPTLNAGDSTTLTFQFTSLQTGQVVASYLNFDTNNGTTGNLNFTLGVYANGTPESPDTLVLPSSVDNLPSDVVDAAMRVLGQAWSVATAPANTLPASVIPTSKSVVTQKALALAEAGLRQSLGEPLPNALRDLATDFFGGSTVDPGFDQVLRTTPAGQNFVNVLGANLAQPMTQAGGAAAYELQLAQIEASGPNFVTFAVGNGTGAAPVSVALTDGAGNQITNAIPGGTIVSGALFPLGNTAAAPYLGLITSPTNSPYTLLLTGQASGSVDISISIPEGDGTVVRGVATGVPVVAGQQMKVVADFTNPNNLVLQIDTAGDGSFATSVPLTTQIISPPGPTLISATVIGSQTVSEANDFGTNIVVLFDRIVDTTTSATPANYSIPNNSATSASKQLSGRLVFANLAQPEGPYVPTTVAVSGIADQRGSLGASASVSLQSMSQYPGAVVTGRVLEPDGTASTTATVNYANFQSDPTMCQNAVMIGLANVQVQGNGVYQYRYVLQSPCGPFQMSTKDPSSGAVRAVTTSVRSAGQQLVIDLALLGQGSVTGTVTDLTGAPVYNAQVVAISGTDPQVGGSTFTDATGHYVINGITVGPITVRAVKGIGLGNSAGNIERAGTTAVVNVVLNGGAVNVSGVVTQLQAGVVSPVPGEPVVYYLTPANSPEAVAVGVAITASNGSYSIAGMPTGPYLITAAVNSQLTTSQTGIAAAGQNLIIPLQIVVPVTNTVSGTVTLPNGSPVAGAIVSQGSNGVLSNTDGTYSLPGISILPSQSQVISARTADGTRSGQTSVVVNAATPPVTGANITLSGLGNAQFTVLDPTGKPVAGQAVTLPNGSPDCAGNSQTTNASGIAIFPGIPVGTIKGAAKLTSGNAVDLATGFVTITQDGTTGFATLRFRGFGTVTGNVVDPSQQPVLGAVVQLSSNSYDPVYCTLTSGVSQSLQTDPTGKFQFTGVNIGTVGVTASQSFYPTPVGAQGTLPANGATINFPLQLTTSTSGVLSGTVFLPDGVTPAGAGVQVTVNGPLPNVSVNTDASGSYAFAKILPQGMYTFTINDPISGGTNQQRIFLSAGQNTTENLRLLGTGTINVTVVDGGGVPVSSAFVTLTETNFPNASFSGSLDASNQGVLSFSNVFEGPYSVQATDVFARGGRSSGTLPQGIATINTQVQLTTTGTVQGHYYMPDGVTPIPNASIVLTASGQAIGQFTSLGTGDIGSYSFQYVPAGPVELKAQDPLTGRTGIAAGTVTTQGQTLTLDVRAQGLEVVQGLVTSNGAPQAGALVAVVSGTFQASTEADSNGMYVMNGVPEGVIVATASLGNGFLSGSASSTISGDGNSVTLNVALRSSGTVTGQVLRADGVTPASTSIVSINVGGVGGGTETTTTDAQGNFSFQNVPSGSGTISAQVLGGIDQSTIPVNVAAGTTTNIAVKLNGTGAIAGLALDSSGNPIAGTIVLTGTGAYPYYLNLTAAVDGTFAVPQVLAEPFTAQLSADVSGFTLYGTTTGTIVAGQTNTIHIQVQPSGTVTGLVLRPDGQTPAVGALITIQLLGGGGSITLQAQNDGTFTAAGVPLGAFSVRINDPTTASLAAIQGQSLASNGQTLSLGTITLDGNALSVVASNPTDGATGVPINQALMVTFSEALTNTNGISVTSGTSNLPLTTSLSSDGKTVTLQGTWPDGVPLALNVTGQVTDVFGRQFLQPLVIHFTTVDLTPPVVLSISPANGALQVPLNATVAVTFNKALSATASLANVITLSVGSVNLPGTTILTAQNVLTFTPAAALANNNIYNVTVNGAVSFGGNVQTVAYTGSFVSPETTPPILRLISPVNGAYVNTATPTISIQLSDPLSGINTTTGTLTLDGQPVTPNVGSTSINFTPPMALASGSHAFSATVLNNAGVLGSISGSFIVDTAPPSLATLTGITAGQVLKGQISVSASASDTVSGIAKINLLVDGFPQVVLTGPSFSGTFNSAVVPDGSHSFAAQAVNNAGTSGPSSAPVQAFVENVALTISITSPANGASFGNSVLVTASTSKPVTNVVFTLGLQSFTVSSTPYQATFDLTSVAAGQQTITATALYIDGSTVSTTVTILVDHTPPAVNPVLIAANPPVSGVSLIRGLSGATEAGAQLSITNVTHPASVVAQAASDGSFSGSLAGAVGDTLSLTATDAAGNSSTPITFTIPQSAPLPQVAQVQPANTSTNFALNGHIVVRFTQPVAPTSVVGGTLQLLQGTTTVAGTVMLSNDSLSLTFAPSQNLLASTPYTVVVQDVADHQTSPLFQSAFTTGSTTDVISPQIVQASPQSGVTGVPTNAPVHVQFTEAMDPATLTPQNFIVTDETTGQHVPGMVQVDATGFTASFVPQPLYGIGRGINVQLTSSIKDTFGNALVGGGNNFTFTTGFGTDTQGPTLVGVSPTAGLTNVPLNSLVVAEFDTPLDVVSATNGFEVQFAGAAIRGGIALSDGNKRITFTPLGGLTANSSYTVMILPQVADVAGNTVTNPGNSTFVTSGTTDATSPQATSVSPANGANGASGVATNAVVQLQFSKRIDPFTVNGSTFYLYPSDTGIPVAESLAVSADGLTATLTPTGVLQTATSYQVIATNGITDLEGQAIAFFEPTFTTGLGTATAAPTAVSVSPPNGAVGVPVNGRVDVRMSAPVSLASVVSGVVTLSASGTAASGTLSVSGDRMTVTFTPSGLLGVSTSYTVAVSGLTDQSGNVMVPFTSAFTTGTSGVGNTTRPSVVSVSPGNGATGVAVNSSIVLTFNEAIDATTVNGSTVAISDSAFSGELAGSYAVDATGRVVTFTPLSPLPGSATIQVQVSFNGVADFSGNGSNSFSSSFTTAAATDTSAPQVVMVTPGNGTVGVGLNAVATLTFTKSLNPGTVNGNTFGLLANGSKLGVSTSISADNRVVTLSAGTLPGSSVVTVVATSGVTDLNGNALSNFESSFTTGVADTTHPVVVSQRPGNAATGVPVNENVVLYLSEAMNVGTLPGAVHVSQNGVLVSGTVAATENGQVVVFTPAAALQNGALVQVFVDATAQDVNGNSLSAYQGSYTTVTDTSAVAPVVVSTSPSSGVSGIATNVVIDIGFNEALSAATVNGTNVYLTQGFSTVMPSTVSLVNGGTAIQIVPNGALAANTQYYFHVTNGVLGTNGQAYAGNFWNFTTGSGTDTVAPVIVTVSPPNGSTNVGDNIILDVQFSKAVNPVTVNGSTIQLSGGGTTQVADAISFSNNNQRVVLVPHGPLPDQTVMTITISGVTDVAGNAVVPQTTTFTTGAGPDLSAPAAVSENPYGGEMGVPLNAVVQLQVNEPVDPGSVNGNTLEVQDQTTGQQVAGSYSVSADGRTVSFVPGAALAVSRSYVVFFVNRGITDLAGNQLTSTVLSNYSFTTGVAGNTSGPSVVGVSPANGLTGVPINAQVVVQFSEAVDAATLGQVTLSGVPASARLSNGNQTLTLIPVVPLTTNTAYTVTVTGVQDVSGNALVSPETTTFTTGAGADLTAPSVISVSPANGASGVATNAVVQLQFSKRIDPLSVTPSTFLVFPTSTGIPIAGALAISANGLTATFTPNAPLSTTVTYEVQATAGIVDIEGQPLPTFESSFQ